LKISGKKFCINPIEPTIVELAKIDRNNLLIWDLSKLVIIILIEITDKEKKVCKELPDIPYSLPHKLPNIEIENKVEIVYEKSMNRIENIIRRLFIMFEINFWGFKINIIGNNINRRLDPKCKINSLGS